ncbi:CBS domain-containing protein [Sphingomonas sp. ID1715]|uniref:CBS domain-containing protein n=1 Tax=Sphingomonas sp. ID1715 TaxID=1656898 RepID=UPI0014880108|nr:CBS domain-containing protein [Sphingomonas sp. ID1715]NNM78684.1 CBS domain-containing protein [Sphingomonas sp. ID1715]
MTIAAVLKGREGQVIQVAGDARVAEAIALLSERRIGALPVLDGDRVIGIFSERDVIYCMAKEGAAALSKRVSEVMTAPAQTVEPGQSVLGALSLMTERRFRHLPVVDGGRLVGFVSIGDLVKYRIDKIEAEAAMMRDYIQTA